MTDNKITVKDLYMAKKYLNKTKEDSLVEICHTIQIEIYRMAWEQEFDFGMFEQLYAERMGWTDE